MATVYVWPPFEPSTIVPAYGAAFKVPEIVSVALPWAPGFGNPPATFPGFDHWSSGDTPLPGLPTWLPFVMSCDAVAYGPELSEPTVWLWPFKSSRLQLPAPPIADIVPKIRSVPIGRALSTPRCVAAFLPLIMVTPVYILLALSMMSPLPLPSGSLGPKLTSEFPEITPPTTISDGLFVAILLP